MYISQAGLQAFAQFQYKGVDKSLLAKYILQPFWNYVVTLMPMWLAPNLITLLGLLCSLFAMAVGAYYCPSLSEPAPTWFYLLAALCLFLYQTLDAIDGKQARRTKSSSPLGQLFDHGCDALNTGISWLTVAAALRLGTSTVTLVGTVIGMVTFYAATWEEYHTGVLYLGVINGPDEGIIGIIGLYLFTAFTGSDFWLLPYQTVVGDFLTWLVPAGTPMNVFAAVSAGGPMLVFSLMSVVTVVRTVSNKGGSIAAAMLQWTPMLWHLGVTSLWVFLLPDLYQRAPHLMLATSSFIFSYITMRLILAHLCHEDSKLTFFINFVSPLMLFIPSEHAYTGMCCMFVVAAAQFFHFAVHVINDITSHLRIKCFSIVHPRDD